MSEKGSWQDKLRPTHVPSLNLRWLARLLPLLMIGLAVHLLLPQLADLQQAWQTVLRMPWWLVVLAVVMQVGSYAGSGFLLVALARMLDERLALGRAVAIALAGGSVGLVAVGMVGSSAATYRWVREAGLSPRGAGLCGTLPSVFNNALLIVIAALGLIHLLLIHQLSTLQAISFGLILAVLALLLGASLWGVNHPKKLIGFAERLARWWAVRRRQPFDARATAAVVNQLLNTWIILRSGGWRGPALGAALNIGGDVLTLFFVFLAVGHPISPGILLTGYGLPLLIGKVGIVPGGVGLVEATMTAIYASLGVPSAVTVVVILGYRLLSFWIPTLLGFPTALFLRRPTPQAAGASGEQP